MSEKDRSEVLHVFDTPNQQIRTNFVLVGHVTPQRFQLKSTYLANILKILLRKYSVRYVTPFDEEIAQEFSEEQKILETHHWMVDLVQKALENDEWNAIKDHAQRQE